jgi:hypothetical protein
MTNSPTRAGDGDVQRNTRDAAMLFPVTTTSTAVGATMEHVPEAVGKRS